TVKSQGLVVVPSVPSTAVGPVTDMTTYRSGPGLLGIPTSAASNLVAEPDGSRFAFDYNIRPNTGDFGGVILTFGANGKPMPNLTSSNLVFDVSGTTSLKVSVSDNIVTGTNPNGSNQYRSVTLLFTGITATNKYIAITKEDLQKAAADFGYSTITSVAFVVDQKVATGTGTITVRSQGLSYSPTLTNVAPYCSSASCQADISHMTGFLNLVGFSSKLPDNAPAVATASTLSATRFNVTYNVTNAESFGGSISTFDDFSTVPKESHDLSALTNIVLGLRLQSGTGNIILEIEDSSIPSHKAGVRLTGVNTTEQFYRIDKTLLTGIDWAHISNINIVVVSENVSQKIGVLEVRFGDNYTITFTPGTTYNDAAISSFGTYYPGIAAGTSTADGTPNGRPNATLQFNLINENEFEYHYDISESYTAFTFASINMGGDAFRWSPPTSTYVFAALGSEGARLKIEVKDINDKVAAFVVLLSSYYQNYTLDLAAGVPGVPAGFDYTRIKEVVFVQDWSIGSPLLNDYVKVRTKKLDFTVNPLPDAMIATQNDLTQSALGYFAVGAGVDPLTHFPYDNRNATGVFAKFTQPTLIGFYLQILGDVVRGALSNGMTPAQALTEINTVVGNLLTAQTTYGWRGLLPWLNLNPLSAQSNSIGLGDNANLAQSIAVMIGALEAASLSAADRIIAQQIVARADQFLNNQATGYTSFVDAGTGLFYASVHSQTGVFSGHIDRLASEFRGAIAFLKVRFPSLPSTVWDNLVVKTVDYVDRNGQTIQNLAAWDGGAFQIFWPLLRNNEMGFVGFYNALYNHLMTQLDYAYQSRIPGILSASLTPESGYSGDIGIPQIAESNLNPNAPNTLLIDIGSTYALASAMAVDPYAVLGWLGAIGNLSSINDTYGYFDAARSNSEVGYGYIGIDVASMILGLMGKGPQDFDTYLQNRNLTANFNALYDSVSRRLYITPTKAVFPNAPEFPDRSLAVFSHFASESSTPGFPSLSTTNYGVRFQYSSLSGVGGHSWTLNGPYNATANQLFIHYSTPATIAYSQPITVQLSNASHQVVYSGLAILPADTRFSKLIIDLPNQTAINSVTEVSILVDSSLTGYPRGDFTIHAINFQHVPSAQNLLPESGLGSADVTVLPGNGVGQLQATSPNSTLQRLAPNVFQMHFDVTDADAVAKLDLNFNPNNNGSSINLTAVPNLVFGIDSTKAKWVYLKIWDANGKTANYFVKNVDVARNYYQFLTALAAMDIDLTHVTHISFAVTSACVNPGDEIGDLRLEIGGLL
ncbi:MAG TPA: hypothetical protein PLO78_08225, partial [Candidatus Omnitrophota bacterium]|nr:hypothetical protein [Candidatus Omnitrophota bacterium]